MSLGRRTFHLGIAITILCCLHFAGANRIQVFTAVPNLAITGLLVACMFVDSQHGAILGFLTGLIEASWSARYMGSLILTRTVTGLLVGGLEDRLFRDHPLVVATVAFTGSFLSNTLMFLFAPRPHASLWITAFLAQSVYNAAISIFLYFPMRRSIRLPGDL